jgi:hypothetical protein
VDNGAGAANPGFDSQCRHRAVARAGTAFDAGVTVDKPGFATVDGQGAVRADGGTHPTPDAFTRIELQGDDVIQVA